MTTTLLYHLRPAWLRLPVFPDGRAMGYNWARPGKTVVYFNPTGADAVARDAAFNWGLHADAPDGSGITTNHINMPDWLYRHVLTPYADHEGAMTAKDAYLQWKRNYSYNPINYWHGLNDDEIEPWRGPTLIMGAFSRVAAGGSGPLPRFTTGGGFNTATHLINATGKPPSADVPSPRLPVMDYAAMRVTIDAAIESAGLGDNIQGADEINTGAARPFVRVAFVAILVREDGAGGDFLLEIDLFGLNARFVLDPTDPPLIMRSGPVIEYRAPGWNQNVSRWHRHEIDLTATARHIHGRYMAGTAYAGHTLWKGAYLVLEMSGLANGAVRIGDVKIEAEERV